MSMARILTGLWKNSTETGDKAKDPQLKTRYYKVSKRVLLEKINFIVNNKLSGWNITHLDTERGEMLIEKKGMRRNQIVVTVYQVEPLRCSVDVVSAYEGLGDLGLSYFTVLKFFEVLNKEIAPERK
ncbi:hypothetical protein [Lederbergia citrea]|uniref:Uncharacterized protein n=1 Tax=Lederbergia citrea TaxID=2833581 RepID=A0A942UV88_9BACI|nr:hypothetical protein [Lederbergia citrea]MBS4179343.1 hypothetical protein [Lederbergia citrea]MBS4206012.1 hypothetical protein [Lederbergia citrea]MBS4224539.1 hypothetical protein [Lederbergia citrea]